MTKPILHLEPCHPYLSEGWTEELKKSILVSVQLPVWDEYEVTVGIMVDDIHGELKPLEFYKIFPKHSPYLFFESNFTAQALSLAYKVPVNYLHKETYNRGERTTWHLDDGTPVFSAHKDMPRYTPTCSLFVAAWHAAKFGLVSWPDHQTRSVANKAHVVLPERFRKVEDQAASILKTVSMGNIVNKIEHTYF